MGNNQIQSLLPLNTMMRLKEVNRETSKTSRTILLCFGLALLLSMQTLDHIPRVITSIEVPPSDPGRAFMRLGNTPSMESHKDLTDYLFGPDNYGSGCSPGCGCPRTPKDCPQWYSIKAIEESASIKDPKALAAMDELLEAAKGRAYKNCQGSQVQKNGGWCLTPRENGDENKINFPQGVEVPMAQFHVKASKRIVGEITKLIKNEGVTSINDFGAGIAQYKSAVLERYPDLDYHAYDGSGNGEEYTTGMLSYFDLTIPLNLPVADWIVSLEVGEHIPSKFEGMVIRNLHRHNRKGIILSWGVLGQQGHAHINNHSNEYLIRVFESLGYTYDASLSERLRDPKDNYRWFTNSIMAFRKNSSHFLEASPKVNA